MHLGSPDRAGGRWSHHSFRRIRKPHATGKLHGCVFYRTGDIVDRSLHYGMDHFAPVTLTMIRCPSYRLQTWAYPLGTYPMCENKLSTSKLSTVVVLQPANACI